MEEKNTWRPLSDLRLSKSEKFWDGNGQWEEDPRWPNMGGQSSETSSGQEHPGRCKLNVGNSKRPLRKVWDQRRLIYESVAVTLDSILATLWCIRIIKLGIFNMLLCSVAG